MEQFEEYSYVLLLLSLLVSKEQLVPSGQEFIFTETQYDEIILFLHKSSHPLIYSSYSII